MKTVQLRGFGPGRVACGYVLFGVLWILLSDWVVLRAFGASAALPLAQTLKGLLYVGVTAVLVYALARLSTRSIREEQARLQAQHARDERRLATLLDLTRTLLAEPRPGSSRLQILTETIVETLDVERASVWEIDAASGKLVCRDLYERGPRRHSSGESYPLEGVSRYCRALREFDFISADDALSDPRTSEFRDAELIPHRIASMLDAPVIIGGELQGSVCLQHTGSPRRWTEGEHTFVVAVANLLAAMRLRDALRRSEARFREMADNLVDVFYNYDPVHDKLLYGGPSFERIWGLKLKDAYANPTLYLSGIHPDDLPAAADAFERQKAGEATEVEFRVVRPDGSTVWVLERAQPLRGADGHAERIVGTMRDVTAMKVAHEALRESRELLAGLLNKLPGAAYRCLLDADWTNIYMSDGILPMTGWSPADYLRGSAITYAQVIHPDDRGRVWDVVSAAAARREPFELEYRILTRDGEEKVVWERGRFHEAADGEGYLEGVLLDITARSREEAQRRLLEERLRQAQKLEAIGQLAGGVAHDFNNLLTVILVRSEMAQRRSGDGAAARLAADLREIHDTAERASALTRQLLTYARRQAVETRAVDLNRTVEAALPMLQRLAGDGIRITWAASEEAWDVELDPSQVDQILVNLCSNARDAMEGSGTLRLETRTVTLGAEDCARRPGLHPGDHLVFSVSDDGSGMNEETMARLFEPFFTTKGVGKGTGLGLSTVHGIVHLAHGAIEVDSKPGQGATFRIYLPRRRPDSGTASAPVTARTNLNALARGNGETVLVADADPAMRRLAGELLEAIGYTPLLVANRAAALETAVEHAGDIHLYMGNGDSPETGCDLAAEIRARRPRIANLFMTAQPEPPRENPCGPEPDHWIRKPFSTFELAMKIHATLRGIPDSA